MAKIVVRIPEPKPEYDVSNQKQINRAIARNISPAIVNGEHIQERTI
jgi:hypothetical protein